MVYLHPISRAPRLLALIEELRRHRRPVRGAVLAEALGISLRTLYRDIATLSAQGAPIAGEAGIGYIVRPGFILPPLMFSEEELEALVLGARWVGEHGDASLAVADRAAVHALHEEWCRRTLRIAQEPTEMEFGFTFTALDPDGHRLRVFAPQTG